MDEGRTLVDSVEVAVDCAETEAARAKAATVVKKRILYLVNVSDEYKECRRSVELAERV